MTSYFQYNDNKTKKKPKTTEHGTEIVDIPGIMVTEAPGGVWLPPLPRTFAWDRHGWSCPCVQCRIDRGEE